MREGRLDGLPFQMQAYYQRKLPVIHQFSEPEQYEISD